MKSTRKKGEGKEKRRDSSPVYILLCIPGEDRSGPRRNATAQPGKREKEKKKGGRGKKKARCAFILYFAVLRRLSIRLSLIQGNGAHRSGGQGREKRKREKKSGFVRRGAGISCARMPIAACFSWSGRGGRMEGKGEGEGGREEKSRFR